MTRTPVATDTIGLNAGGGEPLTPLDRLTKKARGIAEANFDLWQEGFDRTTSHLQADDVLRLRIAEKGNALVTIRNDPRSTQSQIDKAEAAFEAAKKKLSEAQAKRHAAAALRAGDKKAPIEEFLSSSAIHRRIADANTTDELQPGKDPRGMCDYYAERFRALHQDCVSLKRKPRPEYEIADQIDEDIDRFSADVALRARHVGYVDWISDRNGGHFEPRRFDIPSKNIPNGIGGLSNIPDMGFVVWANASEIKAKLLKLALEGHDADAAIPMGERIAQRAALEAEILQTERLHEFWVRACFAEGINPGPRISNNPLAILDIVVR